MSNAGNPSGGSIPTGPSTGGTGSAASSVSTGATVASTHEMIVAILILSGLGMIAVILAGESKTAGNAIAGLLGIMLVVQGVTHVNPFVTFLTAHPLTPKTK